MKLLGFIRVYENRSRTKEEFERLCEKILEDPSLGRGVPVRLDNEFYAHFGMSAEELSAELSTPKSRV